MELFLTKAVLCGFGYVVLPLLFLSGSARTGAVEAAYGQATTSALKGFAIIVVLLHHYAQLLPVSPVLLPLEYGGFYAVGLFFFLSGYGLARSAERNGWRMRGFLHKRLLRVAAPCALFMALALVAQYATGVREPHWSDLIFIIGLRLLANMYWYIDVLFAAYACFYVLFRLLPPERAGLLLALAAALFTVAGYALHVETHWYSGAWAFPAGVAVVVWRERLQTAVDRLGLRALLATGLLFAVGFAMLSLRLLPLVGQYLSLAALLVLVARYCGTRACRSPLLALAGAASLELYLVHAQVLTMGFVTRNPTAPEVLVAYMLLSSLAGLALHRLFARLFAGGNAAPSSRQAIPQSDLPGPA